MKYSLLLSQILLCMTSPLLAHDTWVETNTNLVRTGDVIHTALKLGNHGNDHRDFKLAGKVNLDDTTWTVLTPGGTEYDLKPGAIDEGYVPKEGYWSSKFVAADPGLHVIAHRYDAVVSYAPKRTIKSAKTCFVASKSLDNVSQNNPGFNRALGHDLELIPISNPVTPMGPGQALEVELRYKGKPLPNATISFIPRGTVLKESYDEQYERTTNAQGRAKFEPREGNVYLIVAHQEDPTATGEGYTSIKYSATLTLYVPQICPCCGE